MKHKYYVIFDTNVLISSLISKDINSYPTQLLNYMYDGAIIPIFSDEILSEYKEVLSRETFPFNKKIVGDLINVLKSLGIIISPEKLDIELIDNDDLIFYEVLMDKDNYDKNLVTGNIKHFPLHPNIKTPKEMVEIIKKGL